jgi:anti-sigma factor (TIGR02949 family)
MEPISDIQPMPDLPPHDCGQVVQKVYLALDGEMSQADMRVFLADIQRCSHCLEHYKVEERFKQFLQHRLERKQPPNGIREQILNRLNGEI